MGYLQAGDLVGKPLVSGLGERLGIVVEVELYPSGYPRRLVFRDAHGELHRVKAEFVKAALADRVEMKGPREGFHITLRQPAAAPAAFSPAHAQVEMGALWE